MPKTINDMTMPMMIISVVFDYFGIDTSYRTAKVRDHEIVLSRQVSMYYIKKYTKQSLAGIGSYFQKDHATILHAIKTVNNYIDTDKKFRCDIERINNRILSKVMIDDHKYDQYDTDRV